MHGLYGGMGGTLRNQQVDVVAAHIVLCQPHNGTLQTLLTMVVSRVLRHIASKLSHLYSICTNSNLNHALPGPQVQLSCGPHVVQASFFWEKKQSFSVSPHLDICLQVPLEAGEQDLALPWLEPIHHAGNGPLKICS